MSGCLNFGKLQVGQQVVGAIKTVNDFDMVVSLPNQLTGFVACDRISEPLAAAFAALSGGAETEGGNGEGLTIDPSSPTFSASLTTYYQPGELVIATIVAIERGGTKGGSNGKKGARRRIELSLRPDHLNSKLTKDVLLAGNCLLMGTIRSREDHGYAIDFACAPGQRGHEETPRGFLPDKEITSGGPPLLVGKTAAFLVRAAYDVKGEMGRVLSVTMDSRAIAEAVLTGRSIHRDALLPGALVQAEIKAIHTPATSSTSSGLGVRLVVSCGGHEGRIDILNLPEGTVRRRLREVDWGETFPIGKRILARIIHVDREEGHYLLSCLEPIVHWRTIPLPPGHDQRVGRAYEGCSVLRIDAGLGVLIQLGLESSGGGSGPGEVAAADVTASTPSPILAYVHISRLSDEHVERIEGPYKVGSKHRARLIDYDAFSGLYQASLQGSILKEALLRPDDLHPGQVVRGQVIRMESYGALVALTERIRALCPTHHLTEVQSSSADTTLRSLQLGQRYKFRVLDCDPRARRITLTRKRGLLDTTLPLLTDYAGAVAGNWHEGYVAAIRDFGVIVRFWAGIKGIITVAELTDYYVGRPQEAGLFVGQVIRCRIVKCDPSKPELVLSLRQQSGPKIRSPEGSGPVSGIQAKRRKTNNKTNSTKVTSEAKKTIDDLIVAAS